MPSDKVKAAANFKARGIKKAADGGSWTVGEAQRFFEKFSPETPIEIVSAADDSTALPVWEVWDAGGTPKISINTDALVNKEGSTDMKKQAAPPDPIHRDEPAAQADPPMPDPTAQPVAPEPAISQPAPEPVEVEEDAEETPEAKIARWREELDSELGDDDLVTAAVEFLEAESLDLDDYGVKVTSGYSNGTANVELGKNKSYVVCTDDDTAENIAFEQVRNDLESEPEIFNQDWLQGHINEERLRNDLYSDTEEGIRQSPDSYGWVPGEGEELVRFNAEGEEDDDGEYDSAGQPIEEQTEPSDDWLEAKVTELLRYPVQYMQEIYGDADGIKQAIAIAGIDINAAAEEAVAADGWQHFLCRYDGNSYDLPSGGVYWLD